MRKQYMLRVRMMHAYSINCPNLKHEGAETVGPGVEAASFCVGTVGSVELEFEH